MGAILMFIAIDLIAILGYLYFRNEDKKEMRLSQK